ncbi:hypothetical protein TrLO_g2090 [Triparma laevis f. longispina]|uniref:DUF1995 domain-containing protein n=1 Tax=Triparma laevis f. longispina TaxID=1714387 RepID=A0A9W7KWP4_9STRA|nr:hypothetical protein TrLO_g2090 [Triparma laevis f. longispina]
MLLLVFVVLLSICLSNSFNPSPFLSGRGRQWKRTDRKGSALIELAAAGYAGPKTSSPLRIDTRSFLSRSTSGLTLPVSRISSGLALSAEADDSAEAAAPSSRASIYPPTSLDSMVDDVRRVVKRAKEQGINRQIVRTPLPRSTTAKDLGKLYEAKSSSYDEVLVPCDETWQGGIMQLYRACAPVCEQILRGVTNNALPPRVTEDRSVDESGVDGVGLFVTECTDPKEDATAFCQPTQEAIGSIESITSQAKDRLVMLMNPQWRDVDDALDTFSKDDSFFGKLSSFLGGKGATLQKLDDLGYQVTYCFDGYVCKGGNVWLLKTFDAPWHIYAENDDGDDYIFVGLKDNRPSYQDVDAMLTDKGITVKYARDIGMAPKL